MIEEVREKFSLSYAGLAEQLGLGYTTLMRWKRRLGAGQDTVAASANWWKTDRCTCTT